VLLGEFKMAKSTNYKFQVYEETPGDDHIDYRLQKEHKKAPQELTQKQLEDFRVDEKNVSTEKLLEKVRKGSAEVIIEKNLNDSKEGFGVKHRNEETYTGDINKLEEKRLASKPIEKEVYEVSSETPKKLRWWEAKSPDGLKIAQKKITEKIASTTKLPVVQPSQEIKIVSQRYINDSDLPECTMTLSYNPKAFKNIHEAKSAVVYKIAQVNPDLDINQDDLISDGDDKFKLNTLVDEKELKFLEDSYNEMSVNGTPVMVGKISFLVPPNGVDRNMVIEKALDFIKNNHPELVRYGIDESHIQDSKINIGELTYYISKNEDANNAHASSDFPITIIASIASKKLDKEKIGKAVKSVTDSLDQEDFKKANAEAENVIMGGFFSHAEISSFIRLVMKELKERRCSLDSLKKYV
jgi:hypothetical protein